MSGFATGLVLAVAALGHAALWIGLVNRIHSTGMPRWGVKLLSLASLLLVPLIPLLALLAAWFSGARRLADLPSFAFHSPFQFYLWPTAALGLVVAARWLARLLLRRPPPAVVNRVCHTHDIAAALGFRPVHGNFSRWSVALPGNQALLLREDHLEIALERLPPPLGGLSILHLSDLHLTGRIGIDYFHALVDRANALNPDLIVITGDLVDEAHCIDWLPQTLGQLTSRLGAYYVLGNHDLRTRSLDRLHQTLADSGLVHVGGNWRLLPVAGCQILIAGNELPWLGPAADMQHAPPPGAENSLRICLAHSPDQWAWAERWRFDLMLAGHTHGGQICFPFVGPVLSPSWHGVRYAAGDFHRGSALMHVSRGASSELPLRWNCPPELGYLVLRPPPSG